jgi:predicted transcriptional regulator YdeE
MSDYDPSREDLLEDCRSRINRVIDIEANKLRISVCVTVPEDTPVDGEIGKMAIPRERYALARFELAGDEYQEAWNWESVAKQVDR